ncbi:MAG: hypothetical protein MRY78_13575 [Saprospiraceae bacterium]|nr:hypothetical protein [Saprospiraceae bacterium]
MTRLSLILVFCCFFSALCGQSYNTAFGLRVGTEWGFTFKQRVLKHTTLEGIFQSSLEREEVMLTALAEQHFPVLTRRFNIYMGGGIHKGWRTAETEYDDAGNPINDYDNPFGLTTIFGAEITLGRLNVSYDFKPAMNISGGDSRFYFQTGVSLRYVLFKRKWKLFKKKKKFNWKFWEKD